VTGVGECLLRSMAARRIADNLAKGTDADKAVADALEFMTANVGGDGGGIALTKEGEVGIEWNSKRMAWAFIKEDKLHFGCNRAEHFVENL
jgi:beta-aspartyl-peptidase (threonine type)